VGFLREVTEATRAAVADPAYLEGLRAPSHESRPSGLAEAIRAAGRPGALLVEFKRVSPGSQTPELPVRSAAEFVRETEPAGVVGYSCIATAYRFRGSPADVAALASSTRRPVLFKDFLVDPVQLDAAVRVGAAAVLLIARLETEGLLTTPLAELAEGAHSRGLEVLLEFHDKGELRLAADVAADMYGVNSRDLDSLRMEPEVARATMLAADGLRPILGLSGVASAEDARRFWEAGADGLLVGSSVARARDPTRFLRTLYRPLPGGAR